MCCTATDPVDTSPLAVKSSPPLSCGVQTSSTLDGRIVAAVVASLLFVFLGGTFLVCTVIVCKKRRRNMYSSHYSLQQKTNDTSANRDIRDSSVSSHQLERQVCVYALPTNGDVNVD